MAVLDDLRENYVTDEELLESNKNAQEERRKTGRYLAVGIVIFLLVLGLYHAIPEGSSRLLSLLGAALIMLLYLVWLLYSSHRKKMLLKARQLALQKEKFENIVTQSPLTAVLNTVSTMSNAHQLAKQNEKSENLVIQAVENPVTESNSSNPLMLRRTYSVG